MPDVLPAALTLSINPHSMKIYTTTGDNGTTSLVGGKRVSKSSARLEAYGTVDELNSHIGLILAIGGISQHAHDTLTWLQHKLFDLGSELATEPQSKYRPKGIIPDDVTRIERDIDALQERVPPLRQFVLPGGTQAAALSNVARTVARRCERRMVAMRQAGDEVADPAMKFINRISDLLFLVGRESNIISDNTEIFWNKDC